MTPPTKHRVGIWVLRGLVMVAALLILPPLVGALVYLTR